MKARKPVAKAKTKDTRTVNTEDPLADLGLDLPATAPKTGAKATKADKAPKQDAPKETAPVTSTDAADTDASGEGNEEVEVGEIEFGFSEYIPTAKRKAEGSKYKFDALVAPSVWTEGPLKGKPKIANFQVKLQPGVDPDKLRRSVQSATTQANRQGADAGKYFVSRSVMKDGNFVGMIVYRTDERPTKG